MKSQLINSLEVIVSNNRGLVNKTAGIDLLAVTFVPGFSMESDGHHALGAPFSCLVPVERN